VMSRHDNLLINQDLNQTTNQQSMDAICYTNEIETCRIIVDR
jgi:hypothetical protein